MKKVEFHVHTRYSKDSILTYFFLLIMCKIRKIDCIAITDHNEISGAIRYKQKLEKHNIEVIVGEEIFTADGEIIGLYLNEKISADLTVYDTVKKIREQGALVYVPHPYDKKRVKTVLKPEALQSIVDKIDLIEIHNGRNIKAEYSDFQKQIAEENKLVGVVGSDAHTFYELGRNYCLVSSTEKEQLVDSLKKGNFHIQQCIKLSHLNTKIARVIKMIGRRNFHELYRIINRKCKKAL